MISLFREQHDVVVEERVIDRTELYVADEMFLCGTGMEITAVQAVDRFEARGYPGPLTRALQASYHGMVRGESDLHPRVADRSVLNTTASAPTLLESLVPFVVVALAGDAGEVRGAPDLTGVPREGHDDKGNEGLEQRRGRGCSVQYTAVRHSGVQVALSSHHAVVARLERPGQRPRVTSCLESVHRLNRCDLHSRTTEEHFIGHVQLRAIDDSLLDHDIVLFAEEADHGLTCDAFQNGRGDRAGRHRRKRQLSRDREQPERHTRRPRVLLS